MRRWCDGVEWSLGLIRGVMVWSGGANVWSDVCGWEEKWSCFELKLIRCVCEWNDTCGRGVNRPCGECEEGGCGISYVHEKSKWICVEAV